MKQRKKHTQKLHQPQDKPTQEERLLRPPLIAPWIIIAVLVLVISVGYWGWVKQQVHELNEQQNHSPPGPDPDPVFNLSSIDRLDYQRLKRLVSEKTASNLERLEDFSKKYPIAPVYYELVAAFANFLDYGAALEVCEKALDLAPGSEVIKGYCSQIKEFTDNERERVTKVDVEKWKEIYSNPETLQKFQRLWSIETGKIEHLYSFNEEVTIGLIRLGFLSSLIPNVAEDEAFRISFLLQDQYQVIKDVMDMMEERWEITKEFLCNLQLKFTARARFTKVGTQDGQDGNGRVARVIASIPLLKAGLPPLVIMNTDRNAYINSLQTADLDDDLVPFIDIIKNSLITAADFVLNID